MGVLNKMSSGPLYSSDPPYYTYGAPQGTLQPATPPQETQLASPRPPIQRFAKGGPGSPDVRASLSKLRQASEVPDVSDDPDDLQAGYPGETEADYDAGDEGGEYIEGPGTGRSDSIPAELSDGEYVFDAETVALLGDGSSKAGAAQLDELRRRIRMHKGAALAKGEFSPDAKPAEEYLEGTERLAGGGRPRPKQKLESALEEQNLADDRAKVGFPEPRGRSTIRIGSPDSADRLKELSRILNNPDYRDPESSHRGSKLRPKQKLSQAADQQDMADKDGEDPGRETVRVGNTKKSYKDVKDAQSKEQWRRNGWK